MNIYQIKTPGVRKSIATSACSSKVYEVTERDGRLGKNYPAGKYLRVHLQSEKGGSYVAEISKAEAAELLKQLTILTMEADLA